jgi:glycosyltransferase involved in cell wall biosynthesis
LKTVLLFAYACAPYNRPESTIGAQRPAKFAKFLPRSGWRAIVLCADARASESPTDGEIEARVHTALDAPSDHSVIIPVPPMRSDGLLDHVWRRVSGRQGGVWSVIRRPLTLAKFFTGDYSQNWQPSARIAARLVASRTRIDVCLGEHSPDAGIFLARWFAEQYRLPWVADFRDAVLFGQPLFLRSILAPVVRRRLRTAAHVINVTPPCVAIDSQVLRRPVTLIPNGFDPEEFQGRAPERADGRFLVVLAGSVWQPASVELFLSGLRLLVDRLGTAADLVRFRYIGDAAAMVRDTAARLGVESYVEATRRVPRHDALEQVRSADLCVILPPVGFRDPYWDRGGYPGKVFEYFGARRPILAVPADRGVLDELLTRTRTGVTASTPPEIADRLGEAFTQWRSHGRARYDPDPSEVAEFTRVRGAERLAALLNDVVMNPTSRAIGSDRDDKRGAA